MIGGRACAPTVVGDGLLWPSCDSPWAVWEGRAPLAGVLRAATEAAVVSVRGPAAYGGENERFLCAGLAEDMGRLARAALRLGTAIDQPRARSRPGEAELAGVLATAAAVGERLGAVGALASTQRLEWLCGGALEWARTEAPAVHQVLGDGGTRYVRGAGGYHAFLVGPVDDDEWPGPAEGLCFAVDWCVRRLADGDGHERGRRPAAGLVGVRAESIDELDARAEELRTTYLHAGRVLVRPREQLALAAAMVPWVPLARCLRPRRRVLWAPALSGRS
jgi:hypothetical protein